MSDGNWNDGSCHDMLFYYCEIQGKNLPDTGHTL